MTYELPPELPSGYVWNPASEDPVRQQFQGGGKGGSQSSPDYAAAAAQQGVANAATARVQGKINNPNIINPYGQQTVTWGTDAKGKPNDQATVTQKLAPEQQALLNSSNRISQSLADTGEAGLGRVNQSFETPFDTSNIHPLQADAAAREASQNAAYSQATSRLDPQWGTAQTQKETQLVNQGLQPGTPAYDNAMRDFSFGKNDAYSSAYNNSFNQGLNAQQADLGMQNQANQGNIQQQLAVRDIPLNEVNALRTGAQVQNPTFQPYQGANLQAPNYAGAAAQQGAWDQNANANQIGAQNNMMSGLFSIGAATAPYWATSDRRLKSNIVEIGRDSRGFGIYEYDIFDQHIVGVMADEVEKVFPDAVMTDPNGWKMVNYEALYG